MGALAICGALYLVIGGVLAFIVREFFYVPQDFQFGIIVVCRFSSCSSVLMTVLDGYL